MSTSQSKILTDIFDLPYETEPIEQGINTITKVTLSDGRKYLYKEFSSKYLDVEDYLASCKIQEDVSKNSILPVPTVVSYGEESDIVFLICEYVSGESPQFEDFENLEKHKQYISKVARTLGELHSHPNPVDKFGWYTIDSDKVTVKNGYRSSSEFVKSFVEYNFKEIESDVWQERIEDEILQYIDDHVEYRGPKVIGHFDVKYENIIDTSPTNPYMSFIDFEFLRSTDPVYDLVQTERQMCSRYGFNVEETYKEELLNTFRRTYFNSQPFEDSMPEDRYNSYKLVEYVSCFESADGWYSGEEIKSAQKHYLNIILSILR